MSGHGHTLLGFLTVGAAKLREGDEEQNVHRRMSMHGVTSSEVMPLEDATRKKCWTAAREGRIRVPGRAVSSPLKPLKRLQRVGLRLK